LSLDLPTRIQLCVFHRDGTLLTVDTENWPAGDEANDVAAGIEYTLMERADTETWETAEAFLAAYGRAYTVECDTVKGGMTVTVTGEQIPLTGAVTSAS
jgi:hypothetical protein